MATILKKSVLITGCSTGGIGWAMARAFQRQGFHVFATARDPSTAADLAQLTNVQVLELDVTEPETINRAKEVVSKHTGGALDVLVNNAGVEFVKPLLEVDLAEAKRLYDVNVWGPLAVTQAFAPLLIEAKGVIFNQSSIDAELSMVWAGIFASSKSAVARLSETLRLELEPLGVRVITSMCGSANTPMFGKPGGQLRLPKESLFFNAQDAANKERSDHQAKAMDVDLLAEALVKSILGGAQGLLWRGSMSSIVRFMTWALPTWVADRLVNSERGINLVAKGR